MKENLKKLSAKEIKEEIKKKKLIIKKNQIVKK